MKKARDLTGQVFGKFTVIKFDKKEKSDYRWWCRCSCGRSEDVSVRYSVLHKSKDNSGCKLCRDENRLDDLSGKIFGELTVIGLDRVEYLKGAYWTCSCSCGRSDPFPVFGVNLKNGTTKSCKKCNKERKRKSSIKDMTGMVFDKITVIGLHHTGKGGAHWSCICNCGRTGEFVVPGRHLRIGRTTSCRICGFERTGAARFRDLTGQKFGKLTVISLYEKKKQKRGTTIYWLCACDCGRCEPFPVVSEHLKENLNHACKLCGYEKVSESNLNNIAGQKFGMLTVLEQAESYTNPGNGGSVARWLCRCDCGNTTIVRGKDLRSGETVSCGCITESYIATELKKYCKENYSAETEYLIVKNTKTNSWMRTDIYIPDGVYIEVMGIQHYSLSGWHYRLAEKNATTPQEELEYQKWKDEIKRDYAKNNGVYIEVDLRKIKTKEAGIEYLHQSFEEYGLYDLNAILIA
jgi:hypothetical protein